MRPCTSSSRSLCRRSWDVLGSWPSPSGFILLCSSISDMVSFGQRESHKSAKFHAPATIKDPPPIFWGGGRGRCYSKAIHQLPPMIQLGFLKQKGGSGMMVELRSMLTACFRITVQPDNPKGCRRPSEELRGRNWSLQRPFVSTFPPLFF